MSSCDIPTDRAPRTAKPGSGTVSDQRAPFSDHTVHMTPGLERDEVLRG